MDLQAIAGGAVLYVIADEGFKIEGYTWLLLYFVARWQAATRASSERLGGRCVESERSSDTLQEITWASVKLQYRSRVSDSFLP